MPKHKSNIIPFRRIAAIAACLVLVFSFATSANAFSFRDVWNAVVTWAQETFSFSMGVEVSEPNAENELEYESFEELLIRYAINCTLVPSWFPSGYTLEEMIVDETPTQEVFIAIYVNGNKRIKISVKSFLAGHPECIELSGAGYELHTCAGIDYYIFSNYDQNRAVWIVDSYECYISGDLEINELKLMIDSIGKD